jgi:hypothetical protein
LVTRIEDGWVEWLVGEEEDGHGNSVVKGLRLVHRNTSETNCQYDFRKVFQEDHYIVEGLPLTRFVGADGLMLLLSMLAIGEISPADVLELTKRVQIPGYEQAREIFVDAAAQGIVQPAIGDGYYLQSEIQAFLRYAWEKVA